MEDYIDRLEICYSGINYIDKVIQNLSENLEEISFLDSHLEKVAYLVPLFEGIDWLYNVLMKLEDIDKVNFSIIEIGNQNAQDVLADFKDFTNKISFNIDKPKVGELVATISESLTSELIKVKTIYLNLLQYYQSNKYLQ